MPNVPAPSSGLGSNSNYILDSNCNDITGLSVTINVTQDIVCTANSKPPSGQTQEHGFGFQLNAYSPKSEKSGWQQYVISLFDSQLQSVVNNWPTTGNWIINNYVDLSTVPKLTIPAGYTLQISLANDRSNNISAATYVVRSRGIAPTPTSALTGYWGSDSSQHVNFIGTDGHVHEMFIYPGAQWANNDLTAFAGGTVPRAGSDLTGYWGTDSSQHVNFIGTDGHVHELYIHPGAKWVNNDLTTFSGGGVLPAPGSPLAAYWGSDSSQHVLFIGTDGHVHELYIHPGAAWVNNDLTVFAGGTLPAPGSALHAYWGSDSSQHVNFIGTDGHVHELYIHPGAAWVNNDLSAFSGRGVLPLANSPLTGYWGSDSSQHVNFIGSDGHVHELYIHPGAAWVNNDLSVFGGGVLPAPGSKLTGYWGTDSSQHVNFTGVDGHVHELYIHPGAKWVNNDLTGFSGGGSVPGQAAALHAYWGSDSSQHVNFIGNDGHVHELYIHPGAAWVNNDLTDVLESIVTQTLTAISGVDATDIAPITAFELNLVGPANSESATLSSGAGTITYAATSALTVLSSEPSCTESGYITAETANTVYGELPTGSSNSFTQTFGITSAARMIRKTGTIPHVLIGPHESKLKTAIAELVV